MNRRTMIRYAAAFAMAALPALCAFKNARLRARRASRTVMKDGRATAINVIELEVTSEDVFPVRALDPVLHVGEFEVRDYRYKDIENKALIFTCAQPEQLVDNAAVWLQYENDTRTRTDLGTYRSNNVEQVL